MFYTSINLNVTYYLRDRVFLENRATFLVCKELRHRDEIKGTYSRIVFNISKDESKGLAIRTRNRDFNYTNAFKADTATNTTTVAIVTMFN
jgi:hypothetical protein